MFDFSGPRAKWTLAAIVVVVLVVGFVVWAIMTQPTPTPLP
jgi:hypothetical protein